MIDSIRTLMREPLFHFLIAGAGLFLLFSYVSDRDVAGDDEIIVTSGQIEHLVSIFQKTRQRLPSDVELMGLVDNFILEEVLYREATAIGLDKDDTIIRRRLRQKMEFLVDDFSATEPTDEDLQQLLEADSDRFRTDATITLAQFYFSDSSEDAADAMLAALQEGETVDPEHAGASGLLPGYFEDATESSIAAQFGASFKESLFALDVGRWTGPVASPFGIHLIRIEEIVEGGVPALDEIRSVVRREWLAARRQNAQQLIFDELKAKYTITIEAYDAQRR